MERSNLKDALDAYNDHFHSADARKVTEQDLFPPKKSFKYLDFHSPDDGNSYLKTKHMAELKFGWLAKFSEPEIKEVIKKDFLDTKNLYRILELWSQGKYDPLIFIDEQLCDGYHRAALAWHMGLEEYPVLLYKVKPYF